MKICCLLIFLSLVGILRAQNTPVVLDERNVTDLKDAKEWNKFIKSWDAIPLETNVASVMNAGDVYIYDSLVILQGKREGKEAIMMFDLSGKFLRQIGSQGEGEEQYGMVGFIQVDLQERKIAVYDGLIKQRYVVYDFDGNFKGGEPCKRRMHYIQQVFPLDQDRYLGYCVCSESRTCYFISDKNFTEFQTLRPHFARFPMGMVSFSSHPITMYDGRISFVAPLCDTIFEYDGNGLQPRFVTKVHRSVTDDFVPGNVDYLKCLYQLKKKYGCISKDGIYETKNWFLITYENGKLFYNKRKGKAFFISKGLTLRGDMIYPDDLWGHSGEKLIAMYTSDELLAMKDEMQKQGIALTKKMERVFQQVKKGDNPWLVFYTLK